MLRSLMLLLWCLLLALCLAAAAGAQYRDPRDPGLDDMKYRAIHGRPPPPPEEQTQPGSYGSGGTDKSGSGGAGGYGTGGAGSYGSKSAGAQGGGEKDKEKKQEQEAKPPEYRWGGDRLLNPDAALGQRPAPPAPYPSATAAPGSPAAPGAPAEGRRTSPGGPNAGQQTGQAMQRRTESSQPMRLIVVHAENHLGRPEGRVRVSVTNSLGLMPRHGYTNPLGLFSVEVPCYVPGSGNRIVYTVRVADGPRQPSQLVFSSRDNCYKRADLRFVISEGSLRRERQEMQRQLREQEEDRDEEEKKKKEEEEEGGKAKPKY